ncbi:MAG: glycerophosphodiester phosphodiesterase [Acidobacteriota bacterium]
MPLVIGHRGWAARFPDNSLAGVKAAIAQGADGVEVDIRLCAEKVWVCHHDRIRAGLPVAAWDLAGLAHAGVPALAAVVAAVPPERWLFVEVKPLPGAALAAGMAELHRLLVARSRRTRFLSSSLAGLDALHEVFPACPCSQVIDRIPVALPAWLELSPHHTLVERLVELGVALHPWTVNRARRMRELAALGVPSITTNHPDRALEVLGG